MKFRFSAALLLAALSIFILSGCAAQVPAAPANISGPAQDAVIIPDAPAPQAPAPTAPPATEAPEIPTVPPTEAPTVSAAAPTEAPAATAAPAAADLQRLTKEEATAIALADAGFTADQVTRLHTEFDYDDGRPEYEVDFRQGGYEYDYEIHAETGAILSKDIDRED